jgi:hypothetical protein
MRSQMLAVLLSSSGVTGAVQGHQSSRLWTFCPGATAAGRRVCLRDGQVFVGSCSAGGSPGPGEGVPVEPRREAWWTLGALGPGELLGANGRVRGWHDESAARAWEWLAGISMGARARDMTDLGALPGYCGGGLRAWGNHSRRMDGPSSRVVPIVRVPVVLGGMECNIMDYPGWGPAVHHAVSQDGSVVCGQGIHAAVSGYWPRLSVDREHGAGDAGIAAGS